MVTPQELASLETWMEVWKPVVHTFSSNWKDLSTVKATLNRIQSLGHLAHERQLLYFNGNFTTRNFCRKSYSNTSRLMDLICDICRLELELGCQVVVIHVPGKVLIDQSTDVLR